MTVKNSSRCLLLIAVLCLFILNTQKSIAQCYEQVWSEDFNYTGFPDPSIWNMEVGNNNGSNNEKQYYTKNDSDNCYVDSGRLVITARKEVMGGQNYTSARINTKGKAVFQYGKIEARMKLPYGQGIWPAFWMLGSNIDQVSWPKCGEIDIMEMIGGAGARDRTTYGTNHWADAAGVHQYQGGNKALPTGKFYDAYHTFSIVWDKQRTIWYLDGVQFYSMWITEAEKSEFHQNYFIILNLAVGGDWPGNPDATTVFPQKMEVDYVRVYKLAENLSMQGKDSVFTKEKNVTFSIPPAGGRHYSWTFPVGVNLVSPPDSNEVVVDWGCTAGEVACSITNTCAETKVLKKQVKLADETIEGSIFYDKTAGSLFFFVPAMSETEYLWEIPADATFVSSNNSFQSEVAWGSGSGNVGLQISNSCGVTNITRKIYKYGQYPYPDPEKPFMIPGTINSTDFDYGGEGTAYHDTDILNKGKGGPRSDERVDTEMQPLFPNIGYVSTGEWLEYTIKVPVPGYYKINIQTATANTSFMGPVRVLVNGEKRVEDIPVATTGSWTTYKDISQRLLQLFPGDSILRLEAVKGGFNIGPISLVPDNSLSVEGQMHNRDAITVFPNPVIDFLSFNFRTKTSGSAMVRIYDISGKQILSKVYEGLSSGEQKIVLTDKIKQLFPGIYFLEVSTTNQKYFSKFLKN